MKEKSTTLASSVETDACASGAVMSAVRDWRRTLESRHLRFIRDAKASGYAVSKHNPTRRTGTGGSGL